MTAGTHREDAMDTATAAPAARTRKEPILKTHRLSHGTCMVANLKESRKFYEEFLGLEVVRHGERSMMFRLGTAMHVVCVETKPDRLWDMHMLHHWGVDLATRAEVDEAHRLALEHKDRYGIRKIQRPVDQHGVYSFYLQDRDKNWWEVQHADHQNEHNFARGDVYPMDD
jgi:catechol 2,3-dioxygenase-like lactoylglutathione lyase family enzyme